MRDTFDGHWRQYLMESAGLATFMVSASVFITLLEHPGSPVHQAIASTFGRRVLFGIGMGLVVAGIVYSPWGRQSGAHINPAVTWAFFHLGRISAWDATLYTAAQFGGAVAAAHVMRLAIGSAYAHPAVNYAVTRPGPGGPLPAFVGEFVISFVLMLAVLVAVDSQRLKHLVGALTGVLIALYIVVEAPLSGMSLNPARTFGSAIAAGQWTAVWLYFLAPTLAMLLAAELYLRLAARPGHRVGPNYPQTPPAAGAATPPERAAPRSQPSGTTTSGSQE